MIKYRIFAFVAHSSHTCKMADISNVADDKENEINTNTTEGSTVDLTQYFPSALSFLSCSSCGNHANLTTS